MRNKVRRGGGCAVCDDRGLVSVQVRVTDARARGRAETSLLASAGRPEHGGEQEGEAEAAEELGGEVEPDAPVGVVERGEGAVVDDEKGSHGCI